ncbi:DUF3307 domain-containing protein [Parapedobacter lycopersici]|uniref:DUF3307 domain-containing protein n=1 Tax=Parapedobacter lycopersici TaxID=1864939 RepID=UPI00333F0D6F
MILFLKLLLAHIIGDFCFQPDQWVADKRRYKYRSKKLYAHLLIHAIALAIVLGFDPRYLWGFLIILTSHYLLDLAKLYIEKDRHAIWYFSIDQFLHVTLLAIVAYAYEPFFLSFSGLITGPVLLFVTALALAVFVPAVVIRMLIAQWSPETREMPEASLVKAGRFIGILERLFVFIFIITHHWEAVGFLLAAKSIFRFGDLRQGKDRKLTEYVLIGTLLSFGSAILIALAYLYLLPLTIN